MKKRRHVEKSTELTDEEKLNGSRDNIRQRVAETAYYLYEERGRADGHDVDDWLKAETIIQDGAE